MSPDNPLNDITRKISEIERWIERNRSFEVPPLLMGSKFPERPFTGRPFFRTDLGWWCYWDGSRWLTCHEYQVVLPYQSNLSSSGSSTFCSIRPDVTFYAERIACMIRCAATQDSSNYYTIAARSVDSSVSSTTTLYTFDTKTITTGVFVDMGGIPTTRTDATNKYFFDVAWTKTGTPGNINYMMISFYYRLIVT